MEINPKKFPRFKQKGAVLTKVWCMWIYFGERGVISTLFFYFLYASLNFRLSDQMIEINKRCVRSKNDVWIAHSFQKLPQMSTLQIPIDKLVKII